MKLDWGGRSREKIPRKGQGLFTPYSDATGGEDTKNWSSGYTPELGLQKSESTQVQGHQNQPPAITCNPTDSLNLEKRKRPGILRMQADTVMLNPSSTSEKCDGSKDSLESAKQVLGSLNRSGSLIYEQTQRHKTVNL